MTHVSFITLVPLAETHFDVTTVPRVGDDICLEAPNGALVMFKVKKSHGTWQVNLTRGLRQKLIFRWWGGKGVTPFTRAVSRLAPCC
jgi:hypothetical protein